MSFILGHCVAKAYRNSCRRSALVTRAHARGGKVIGRVVVVVVIVVVVVSRKIAISRGLDT